ncbi:hypothetical protein BC827DRAFT_1376097 [Russula dissimulans]|nr:hypothetical protein BC827DRAFT_1387393 [Russula dissimulans]KAH9961711.1 hypothetical protein BC827DRAFT_1376097 [Russula dissimulans]
MHSSYVAFLLLAASAAAPALTAPTPEKFARFGDISLRSEGARAPLGVENLNRAGLVVRGAGSEGAQILNSRFNTCLGDPTGCAGQT